MSVSIGRADGAVVMNLIQTIIPSPRLTVIATNPRTWPSTMWQYCCAVGSADLPEMMPITSTDFINSWLKVLILIQTKSLAKWVVYNFLLRFSHRPISVTFMFSIGAVLFGKCCRMYVCVCVCDSASVCRSSQHRAVFRALCILGQIYWAAPVDGPTFLYCVVP